MASLMNVKSLLSPQFKELDYQSEVLMDQNMSTLVSHATLWYNYVICKQELENQYKECLAKQSYAEAEFAQEQEEHSIDC